MIGVDIVRNERIKEAIERFGERFLNRIYTKRELDYCYAHCAFLPCLAARWAGKEAVLKAFYTEFKILLKFKEIEILGNRGRPPTVVINKEGIERILKEYEVIVSLSHERDYSVAVAYVKRKS